MTFWRDPYGWLLDYTIGRQRQEWLRRKLLPRGISRWLLLGFLAVACCPMLSLPVLVFSLTVDTLDLLLALMGGHMSGWLAGYFACYPLVLMVPFGMHLKRPASGWQALVLALSFAASFWLASRFWWFLLDGPQDPMGMWWGERFWPSVICLPGLIWLCRAHLRSRPVTLAALNLLWGLAGIAALNLVAIGLRNHLLPRPVSANGQVLAIGLGVVSPAMAAFTAYIWLAVTVKNVHVMRPKARRLAARLRRLRDAFAPHLPDPEDSP